MKTGKLQGAGVAIGLFLASYVPAFVTVSLLRPPVQIAIPLIIGISLAIAFALIAMLARRTAGLPEFGFSFPTFRYAGLAIFGGLPLALLVAWLTHVYPSKSPLDTSTFPLWMLGLYFGIGSPIQEEIIFRGLLQSFLESRWATVLAAFGSRVSAATLFTASLFGIVHLGSGIVVFVGALVLGLVAGELRRRSGSLVPAVIVHVLFNVPGLLWP